MKGMNSFYEIVHKYDLTHTTTRNSKWEGVPLEGTSLRQEGTEAPVLLDLLTTTLAAQ